MQGDEPATDHERRAADQTDETPKTDTSTVGDAVLGKDAQHMGIDAAGRTYASGGLEQNDHEVRAARQPGGCVIELRTTVGGG
jgi:hypothetical protein